MNGMGSLSRNKGQRGEREAAAELSRLFGVEACRGRQYSGHEDAPDVRHSIEGVHVEVKRTERLRLYEALEQARGDAGESSVPVVLHKANRKQWVAVVDLDDLPELAWRLFLVLMSEGSEDEC